jgi:1,4-dihydroxy-2-naphthoyl-CoA hydrolase
MLDERAKGTCSEFLGIRFCEIGEDYLRASMMVRPELKQPAGIVHGGINVVLAETVASNAANAVVNQQTHYCVGLEINANHIRATRDGELIAKAFPLHLGRSTQVWQVDINNQQGKRVCVSRMTASVLER